MVGEFLATPARWYAPRIKWRLTQNSCSRSITNFGVKIDPKCSKKRLMNGEKTRNGRPLQVLPRFLELRQLFSALSEQRAMCWAGNTTTRKSLLSRARHFCLVSLSTSVSDSDHFQTCKKLRKIWSCSWKMTSNEHFWALGISSEPSRMLSVNIESERWSYALLVAF